MLPTRTDPAGLAATTYVTVPAPVALLALVTAIQLALLTAVHEQLDPVTTETLPAVVPAAATDALTADRLELQLLPDCVTV